MGYWMIPAALTAIAVAGFFWINSEADDMAEQSFLGPLPLASASLVT